METSSRTTSPRLRRPIALAMHRLDALGRRTRRLWQQPPLQTQLRGDSPLSCTRMES
jgi:hypothetical protein